MKSERSRSVDDLSQPLHQHGADSAQGSPNDTAPLKQPSSSSGKYPVNATSVAICLGASMVALFASTSQAFNIISKKFQEDTDSSNSYVSAFQGIGVIGLQFTLPVGRILDRYGAFVLTWFGLILISGGYLVLSYAHNRGLMFVAFMLVGFGSGGVFQSALSTVIAMRITLGISAVSICMSLCMSFVVFITNKYADLADCDENSCWRDYVRLYAICAATSIGIGSFGLYLFRKKEEERRIAEEDAEHMHYHVVYSKDDPSAAPTPSIPRTPASVRIRRQLSFRESLEVLRTRFFWIYFYLTSVGVGSGYLIITQAKQLWDDYNTNPAHADMNEQATSAFSYVVAACGTLAPIVNDALVNRGYARPHTVLASVSVIVCGIFCALGTLATRPAATRDENRYIFITLMGLGGFGFGSFLILVPKVVGTVYDMKDFGTYMAYMQSGAAAFGLLIPSIASVVVNHTGSYTLMYWLIAGLIAVAGILVSRTPAKLVDHGLLMQTPTTRNLIRRG